MAELGKFRQVLDKSDFSLLIAAATGMQREQPCVLQRRIIMHVSHEDLLLLLCLSEAVQLSRTVAR